MNAAHIGGARALAGITLVVAAVLLFATMDTVAKGLLRAGVPVLVVVWSRYMVQAIITTAAGWPVRGRRLLHTRLLPFQCLRGLLMFGSSSLAVLALRYMAVGEMTAINLITPVLMTMLGGVALGEHVSPLRWALVAGSLAGTLAIIRPGGSAFSWVLLVPLAQVAVNTAFQLLTSRLARTEDPITTHLYTGWTAALLSSLALPHVWQAVPHDTGTLAMLGLMGVVAAVSHFLLILGYQRARATVLTPYLYTQVAFAMVIAWLAFGEVPDAWSTAGIAVIVACGIAGAWLTVREGAPARVPAATVPAAR